MKLKIYQTSIWRLFVGFALGMIIVLGAVFGTVSFDIVRNMKKEDTKEYLSMLAHELKYTYQKLDTTGKGFRLSGDELYIGDVHIASEKLNEQDEYAVIDYMKEYSGAELTFFCRDKRVLTTILSDDGTRYINTSAYQIWTDHVSRGLDYFGETITINQKTYYGYYVPVEDNVGEVVGMAFAGVPSSTVNEMLREIRHKVMLTVSVACLVVLGVALYMSNFVLRRMNQMIDYLSEIDKGNFEHQFSKKILNSKDEMGILANQIAGINDSLKVVVERDYLTGLFNRGAGIKKLENIALLTEEGKIEAFSIAIGDIDGFKKVNDTYGHACGDEVLKKLGQIFREESRKNGGDFTVRWGGEEFLVFIKGDKNFAMKRMASLTERIKHTLIMFEEHEIFITMSFGLTEYIKGNTVYKTINKADELLYEAKNGGKNQIIIG